ncbi:hypothetical protein [Nitrosomonas sp.]|jgi:hypothetical protein|uniref:hypothetical protein n=1 Tax=Nitrosomonas sp. TaxID=42353 RepID=UPI001D4FF094|nr:hypothetical protein [Nitrosomonas sp.]MCB1948595.1 hypothetical protein [Nitrosomonas sp.]
MNIELVYFKDVDVARKSLREACSALGVKADWKEWDKIMIISPTMSKISDHPAFWLMVKMLLVAPTIVAKLKPAASMMAGIMRQA